MLWRKGLYAQQEQQQLEQQEIALERYQRNAQLLLEVLGGQGWLNLGVPALVQRVPAAATADSAVTIMATAKQAAAEGGEAAAATGLCKEAEVVQLAAAAVAVSATADVLPLVVAASTTEVSKDEHKPDGHAPARDAPSVPLHPLIVPAVAAAPPFPGHGARGFPCPSTAAAAAGAAGSTGLPMQHRDSRETSLASQQADNAAGRAYWALCELLRQELITQERFRGTCQRVRAEHGWAPPAPAAAGGRGRGVAEAGGAGAATGGAEYVPTARGGAERRGGGRTEAAAAPTGEGEGTAAAAAVEGAEDTTAAETAVGATASAATEGAVAAGGGGGGTEAGGGGEIEAAAAASQRAKAEGAAAQAGATASVLWMGLNRGQGEVPAAGTEVGTKAEVNVNGGTAAVSPPSPPSGAAAAAGVTSMASMDTSASAAAVAAAGGVTFECFCQAAGSLLGKRQDALALAVAEAALGVDGSRRSSNAAVPAAAAAETRAASSAEADGASGRLGHGVEGGLDCGIKEEGVGEVRDEQQGTAKDCAAAGPLLGALSEHVEELGTVEGRVTNSGDPVARAEELLCKGASEDEAGLERRAASSIAAVAAAAARVVAGGAVAADLAAGAPLLARRAVQQPSEVRLPGLMLLEGTGHNVSQAAQQGTGPGGNQGYRQWQQQQQQHDREPAQGEGAQGAGPIPSGLNGLMGPTDINRVSRLGTTEGAIVNGAAAAGSYDLSSSSSSLGWQEVVDIQDWEKRYGVNATTFERFVWPVVAAEPGWMSQEEYKAAAADPLRLK